MLCTLKTSVDPRVDVATLSWPVTLILEACERPCSTPMSCIIMSFDKYLPDFGLRYAWKEDIAAVVLSQDGLSQAIIK